MSQNIWRLLLVVNGQRFYTFSLLNKIGETCRIIKGDLFLDVYYLNVNIY